MRSLKVRSEFDQNTHLDFVDYDDLTRTPRVRTPAQRLRARAEWDAKKAARPVLAAALVVPAELIATRPPVDLTALVLGKMRPAAVVALSRPVGFEVPTPEIRPAPIGPRPAIDGETQDRRRKLFGLQRAARRLVPDRRVGLCHRLPAGGAVDVRMSPDGRAHLGGAQTCGSVWHCPVCAAKITERRRSEVQRLGEFVRDGSGQLLMLTLTVRHSRHDSLSELVGQIKRAYRYLVSGKNSFTRLFPEYLGTVRALEVTHGGNGWHPHFHVLVAVGSSLSEAQLNTLRAKVFDRWYKACLKVGLGECDMGAFNLESAVLNGDKNLDKLTNYVAKWGAAEELTKLHTKTGKSESRTPWQLLADYGGGRDDYAGVIWREYAKVMQGARQLVWSAGLKALCGLEEITDEQLAAAEPDGATMLHVLSKHEWLAVRMIGDVPSMLENAENCIEDLQEYLQYCVSRAAIKRDISAIEFERLYASHT